MSPQAPNPAYVVTGDLVPDATGDYYDAGIIEGVQAYRRFDGSYYIWQYAEDDWSLSTYPLVEDPPLWEYTGPLPPGIYLPIPPTTGEATVSVWSP